MSGTYSVLGNHVLVLNKHYMAIRIINIKRAMMLLCKELAEVVVCDDGYYSNYNFSSWLEVSQYHQQFSPEEHDWLHTVKISVAVPRIVRLLFYDRLPKGGAKLNRRNIFARDNNHCQYCGRKFKTSELTLDHVVPRSLGGRASWENLVCACVKCNNRKGGRTPHQANMKLINPPSQPNRCPTIELDFNQGKYSSWKQFLDHAYWTVELK
ncbi:MAG: HNH endonuclease [Phycisphaerae bacterium]|nr:HNH endonuclease [Phycisphaerae bacterium]